MLPIIWFRSQKIFSNGISVCLLTGIEFLTHFVVCVPVLVGGGGRGDCLDTERPIAVPIPNSQTPTPERPSATPMYRWQRQQI